MRYLFLLLLVGCDSLYYRDVPTEDTAIYVTVHTDSDALAAACGFEGDACAHMREGACFVHLPERAGWEWHHELTHCFGSQDAP
jgi:hypothetical protein